MIDTISIENYRCFHKTQIENFRLINLIGGKNNVGKTALLEVLYLLEAPQAETILNIGIFRKEHFLKTKTNPNNLWDNFFYENDKEKTISISSKIKEISIEYKSKDYVFSHPAYLMGADIKDESIYGTQLLTVSKKNSEISNENSTSFVLYININKKDKLCLYINGNEIEIPEKSDNVLFYNPIAFLPSSDFRLNSSELVKLYSQARIKDKTTHKILLEGFKCIDEKIELVESLSVRFPSLYLARENEQTRPLKMYGDAMNRIAEFILRLVSNPNGILLIDEIENGIHYTTQQKVWEIIFTLAIKHNVQVFATTHSLEMIKAYAKIAENYPEKTAYFEMYRSARTGEIAASLHDIDLLKYELANNNEIRGEQ